MNASDRSPGTIRPMGWGLSLLLFAVPGALAVIELYVVVPALIAAGMKPFYAQMIPIVFALMLAASIVAYRLESRPLNWAGIRERFRLHRLTGRHWLWVLGGTIGSFALYYLFTPLGQWLIGRGIMPLPASLPTWLDPRVSMPLVARFNQEAGGLQGNWLAFALMAIHFCFNIIGEEFWWRGYILPRQELAFGKWTWLVHGALWAVLFHAFKWWDVIGLLPGDLLMVYIVWRTKNTTTIVIMHTLTNISAVLFVLLGVLGVPLSM